MKKLLLLALLVVGLNSFAQENRIGLGIYLSQVGGFEPHVRFNWGPVLVGAGFTLGKRYQLEDLDSSALTNAPYQNETFINHTYYLTFGMPFAQRFSLEVLVGLHNRQRIGEIPNKKFLMDETFTADMGMVLGFHVTKTISLNAGYTLQNWGRMGVMFYF